MRRRSDVIDTLLEDWASWRYIYKSLDIGTGDSSIVRFIEPRSTQGVGSVPLWQGRRTGRRLLALDNDLQLQLGPDPVTRLVALYGMAGPIDRKANAMEVTVNDLQALRRQARRIALAHVSSHLAAEVFYRDRFRSRSKKPGDTARPHPAVPEKSPGRA